MSHDQTDPEIPELDARTILRRLLALALFCVGVILGGFWLLQAHLIETAAAVWAFIKLYWYQIGALAFWRGLASGAVLWFKKMGLRWLLVELPKRFVYFYLLPAVFLRVVPPAWFKRLRSRVRGAVYWILEKKDQLTRFLKRLFGDRIGVAMGLIIATLVFSIFYLANGVYLLVWMAAIKIPNGLVAAWRWIYRYIFKKLQIGSFGKFLMRILGRWSGIFRETLLAVVARFSPRLARRIRRFGRRKTEEEERRERRAKFRKAIEDRRRIARLALIQQLMVSHRGDRAAVRSELRSLHREKLRRHRYWRQQRFDRFVRIFAQPVAQPCCDTAPRKVPAVAAK